MTTSILDGKKIGKKKLCEVFEYVLIKKELGISKLKRLEEYLNMG